MAGLKVIIPPATEPVTINEVKAQLRIELDDTSYDAIIQPLIIAAREWCEAYQNRAYITQTLELALDAWPCGDEIDLPRPPLMMLNAVTINGVVWDAANYVVDGYSFMARIVRGRGMSRPAAPLPPVNGIKINYQAGYGNTADKVPQRVKQAILLLVSHWFDNGMCDPPPAVLSLLDLDRVVPV